MVFRKRIEGVDFPKRFPEKLSAGIRIGKCPVRAFPRNVQIRDKRFQLMVRNRPKRDSRKDKRIEHGIRIDGNSHLGKGTFQKLRVEQGVVRDERVIAQKLPNLPGDTCKVRHVRQVRVGNPGERSDEWAKLLRRPNQKVPVLYRFAVFKALQGDFDDFIVFKVKPRRFQV